MLSWSAKPNCPFQWLSIAFCLITEFKSPRETFYYKKPIQLQFMLSREKYTWIPQDSVWKLDYVIHSFCTNQPHSLLTFSLGQNIFALTEARSLWTTKWQNKNAHSLSSGEVSALLFAIQCILNVWVSKTNRLIRINHSLQARLHWLHCMFSFNDRLRVIFAGTQLPWFHCMFLIS